MSDDPVLHREDAERVIQGYRDRIAQYGPTVASLNSGDDEKQRLRHQVHASALLTPNPSILDIGCGLATFYEYLAGARHRCDYAGFDIVPEYVEFCRTRYGHCRFELRNIFLEGIGGMYDSIVMSQTFNNRYTGSDNVAVIEAAIELAYRSARVSVSIDMLSTHAAVKRQSLFYYSPEEMFTFAKRISRRVIIRHDYRSSEFCLQLFHDASPGFIP